MGRKINSAGNFRSSAGFDPLMLPRQNSSEWTPEHAAHLLNRAGFGGTPGEIHALHALGLERAVAHLVAGEEDDDLFPPPSLSEPAALFEQARSARALPDEIQKQAALREHRREQGRQIRDLRAWWLNRMRYTPHPLREKMTLFWHGHFATSFDKTNLACLMWQQNETLRAHALGDFRRMVREVSKDPAMMRYLDTAKNARTKPNENFARELMELFLLGEGVRYTEQDIRESARAFTGYRIDARTLQFAFRRRQFDETEKSFLGRTGPFDGDAIIAIVLEQPECARFIAGKLWTFFASGNPPPGVVEALGAHFRQSGYDIASTMRELFLSREFFSPRSRRAQVKSPVQWIVQTARVLEAPLPAQPALEVSLAQLGQVLFEPPNVKGWDVGRAWISSSTLLFRYNLAGYIVSGKAPALEGFRGGAGSVDIPLDRIAPAAARGNPDELYAAVVFRLVNAPLPDTERERLVAFLHRSGRPASDATVRDFLHLVMSTPEFQMT